jgi:hypothetical protein
VNRLTCFTNYLPREVHIDAPARLGEAPNWWRGDLGRCRGIVRRAWAENEVQFKFEQPAELYKGIFLRLVIQSFSLHQLKYEMS